MSFFSITAVTLLIALLIMFAITMVAYMSSLVKNAYQLKIELRADLEDGLNKVEEATEKQMRMIKRELLDEIGKIRTNLENDVGRRLTELNASVQKQVAEVEETIKRDRGKIVHGFEDLRRRLSDVEHVHRSLQRRSDKGDSQSDEVVNG
ncbi:MAG: hypothetical protein FD149_813 [Rhodospirillaceae bacterium]|nr:MAG: hypothetical protein FD149_813 [Rhodospirillaceae bacterium]